MEILGRVSAMVWGWPTLVIFSAVGVYLTYMSGAVQLRHFGACIGGTVRRFARSGGGGGMSPFQALATALGGTVGTGNIAGVTLAMALGGPGVIFWMWVAAFLGMATKYAEVLLAVKYRERNARGERVGGAMYCIKNGLGRAWRPLAYVFAMAGALAAFGMGSAVQGAEITGAARTLSMELLPSVAAEGRVFSLAAGALVAAAGWFVLSGGMGRLGRVCEALVPAMGLVYVLACLAVIAANAGRLGGVLREILVCAFRPEAVCGGLSLRACLGWGLRRGVFSNEAGLGSAPIAHASTSEKEPVRQGFFGVFEVFADTMVVCTLTGLAILCSGAAIPYGSPAGLSVCVSAFAGVLGGGGAAAVLAACMLLFSLSSLFGWGMYGLRCCEFLLGPRARGAYMAIYALCAVMGANGARAAVWELADVLNALMALPNLCSLLLLSSEAARLTRDYFARERVLHG